MSEKETIFAKQAKTRHVVLLVVACVMLAWALFWAYALISMRLAPPQIDAPAEEYGPLGILGAAVAGAAYGLATLMGVLFFGVSWGVGQVVSALLAMEKRDKPRGLWVASRVLAYVHTALLICTVGLWLLI